MASAGFALIFIFALYFISCVFRSCSGKGCYPVTLTMRTAGAQSNLMLMQRAARLHAASEDAVAAFPSNFSWRADDEASAAAQTASAAPGDDDVTEGSDDEDDGVPAADDVDGNDNDLDNERDANDLDALDADRECDDEDDEDPANAHFAHGYYEGNLLVDIL